jgi:hypothetical protein
MWRRHFSARKPPTKWARRFFDPIPLPGGGECVTLLMLGLVPADQDQDRGAPRCGGERRSVYVSGRRRRRGRPSPFSRLGFRPKQTARNAGGAAAACDADAHRIFARSTFARIGDAPRRAHGDHLGEKGSGWAEARIRQMTGGDHYHCSTRVAGEAALAHIVKDKTEAAHRRSDLFERRRELMGRVRRGRNCRGNYPPTNWLTLRSTFYRPPQPRSDQENKFAALFEPAKLVRTPRDVHGGIRMATETATATRAHCAELGLSRPPA